VVVVKVGVGQGIQIHVHNTKLGFVAHPIVIFGVGQGI
jgi:hypothetical protein